MKTYKYQIILILTLILASCQDEMELNNIENNQPEAVVEKTVENGRFVFSSKESLKTTIKNFQNDEIENVEKEFEKLYERGFRSHKAIVSPENEQLQAKFSEEIMLKRQLRKSSISSFSKTSSAEEEEDEEEFIADPLLASLVNENNEIIVNDTLYKFTKEKGLFFTHVKDSTYLFNFFKEDTEHSKRASLKSASAYRVAPCVMRAQYGGITRVDDRISRYLRPIEDDCYGGGGGSGGGTGSGGTGGSSLSEDEKLQQIISNLPVCEGRDNWFQNIFGKSYYCINYFDSKHRIKTEFWDQKWLIYASAGIQTKTQRKRFWVWWASKSDEIHLGINKIYLKYKKPEPEINSFSHPQLFTNFGKAPIYMYNTTYYTKYNQSSNYVQTSINVTKNSIPFFDYDDDDILNIYIPKVPIVGDIDINLTTGNTIYTESNIKALYKAGFDFLKSIGSNKKKFVVMYQKTSEEIEVLYFADRFKKTNDNKIKHKFYSDVRFEISLSKCIDCENGGIKFKIGPSDAKFRNYTHYELDFYGMARRGSTWKGNRMIR